MPIFQSCLELDPYPVEPGGENPAWPVSWDAEPASYTEISKAQKLWNTKYAWFQPAKFVENLLHSRS